VNEKTRRASSALGQFIIECAEHPCDDNQDYRHPVQELGDDTVSIYGIRRLHNA
jgi:hypothetical protein